MEDEVTLKYTLKKGQRVMLRGSTLSGEILDFRHEGVTVQWDDGSITDCGFPGPIPESITDVDIVKGYFLYIKDRGELDDLIDAVLQYKNREMFGGPPVQKGVVPRLEKIYEELKKFRGY